MIDYLAKSFSQFQIRDLVDVAIVSIFLNIILVWFKRSRAAFILFGIFIMGVIYFFARRYELFLTVTIFQGFFAVFLVALVVIFQEDLRRFFEGIAVWGLNYRRSVAKTSPIVEILLGTIADFSEARIGSLIVIQGRDPLERLFRGGIQLDGELSESILHSIFDPHSHGHDGAVIIRGNRIKSFGIHLPLSQNFSETQKHGTRHAAGLGLAERTDALCLLVSEESGSISYARDGHIQQVDKVGLLATVIERFFRDRFPVRRKQWWLTFLTHHFAEKVGAVLIALALWLSFGQRLEVVKRDFVIPIEYRNLDEYLSIQDPKPREVTVTLSAYERSFNLFDPDKLRIEIDLEEVSEGEQLVSLTAGLLSPPVQLDVEAFQPHLLKLDIEKLSSVILPVEVETSGELPDHLILKSVRVIPQKVGVYSADRKDIKNLKLRTEAISLKELIGSTTVRARLMVPPGIRPEGEAFPEVEVFLDVVEKESE